MERITHSRIAVALLVVLALASVATSAPKRERTSKYLRIEGRVLEVNREARTLIVSDYWSKKLYLVSVPEGAAFRITFGLNQNNGEPKFSDVRRNDRVRMRCTRDNDEHLSRLENEREVITVTAVN